MSDESIGSAEPWRAQGNEEQKRELAHGIHFDALTLPSSDPASRPSWCDPPARAEVVGSLTMADTLEDQGSKDRRKQAICHKEHVDWAASFSTEAKNF
jgi:hypothetical protein